MLIGTVAMLVPLTLTMFAMDQLDQLAADDYGRYDGWDCALFKEEAELFEAPAPVGPNKDPTIDAWLTSQDKLAAFQCEKLQQNLAAKDASARKSMMEMTCTCLPQRQQGTPRRITVRVGLADE